MPNLTTGGEHAALVASSWRRCQEQYGLEKRAARPILRLRQAEAEQRLEALQDRSGCILAEVQRIAEAVRRTGGLLVVTDADRIAVKLIEDPTKAPPAARERIVMGSCWDERVAGTNGVHMGLVSGRPFTVQGRDHYYLALAPFACTSTPLLDADNAVVGSLTISTIDRGREADHLFAQRLIGAAAARVQAALFLQRFKAGAVIRLSAPADAMGEGDALLGLSEDGVISGVSLAAARLLGMDDWRRLQGRAVEDALETSASSLLDGDGPVRLWRPGGQDLMAQRLERSSGRSKSVAAPRTALTRRRLPGLERLASSDPELRRALLRAARMHAVGAPVHVAGEIGCGKSTVVRALLDTGDAGGSALWINGAGDAAACAAPVLSEDLAERVYAASCAEDLPLRTLVIENVQELGPASQAALANLMERLERDRFGGVGPARNLRVVSTSHDGMRTPLEGGTCRADLRSHLAGTLVSILPLRRRADRRAVLRAILADMAGGGVEVTDEAWRVLDAHDWPGNLREARDALQQALACGDGARITPLDLPMATSSAGRLADASADAGYGEADRLRDALRGADWNVSLAARHLGVGRATINRRIKRHGLTRPGAREIRSG